MSRAIERILDASLNRASEGLRVLMDLVRFGLDQPELTQELKTLRHQLIQAIRKGGSCLEMELGARDSLEDVGKPDVGQPAPPHHDWLDMFEANSRRVQEALRTLEETYRLIDSTVARQIEVLRYQFYSRQKDLVPLFVAYSHRSKMDFELYVVTDSRFLKGPSLEWAVEKAIQGGAGCIQLREKHAETREILRQARLLRQITDSAGVTFIINDRVDIALEVGADGVHLGQDDMPLEAARRLSKGSLLIGISTHNPDQALEAEAGGADYINIGPIFQTQTKGVPVHPVTPQLIRDLHPRLKIPFTTMGGIHLDNVAEVVLAGADRVAVVTEVMAAEDPETAARTLLNAIRQAKKLRYQHQSDSGGGS